MLDLIDVNAQNQIKLMWGIMRYGMSAALAAVCLIAGCAKQPQAPGPASTHPSFSVSTSRPNGKPIDVKGFLEIMNAFTNVCTEGFPDDDAASARAKAAGYTMLSDVQVKGMLHGDPGIGWAARINDTDVKVTLEKPPFHACGARATLPEEPDVPQLVSVSIGLWAATLPVPEKLVANPMSTRPVPGGTQDMYPYFLLGPDGKPIEALGAYVVHRPGTPQVEVRIVRMRGNNPH